MGGRPTPMCWPKARHSKAQQRTARHSKAQHGTARHSTPQHGTARHSTAQHGTARHSTAQHGTARHSTAQHGTARHGEPRPAYPHLPDPPRLRASLTALTASSSAAVMLTGDLLRPLQVPCPATARRGRALLHPGLLPDSIANQRWPDRGIANTTSRFADGFASGSGSAIGSAVSSYGASASTGFGDVWGASGGRPSRVLRSVNGHGGGQGCGSARRRLDAVYVPPSERGSHILETLAGAWRAVCMCVACRVFVRGVPLPSSTAVPCCRRSWSCLKWPGSWLVPCTSRSSPCHRCALRASTLVPSVRRNMLPVSARLHHLLQASLQPMSCGVELAFCLLSLGLLFLDNPIGHI